SRCSSRWSHQLPGLIGVSVGVDSLGGAEVADDFRVLFRHAALEWSESWSWEMAVEVLAHELFGDGLAHLVEGDDGVLNGLAVFAAVVDGPLGDLEDGDVV